MTPNAYVRSRYGNKVPGSRGRPDVPKTHARVGLKGAHSQGLSLTCESHVGILELSIAALHTAIAGEVYFTIRSLRLGMFNVSRAHRKVLNRTKARRVVGCMPTLIAKKSIRATQPTGMVGLASPFAESRWMRS